VNVNAPSSYMDMKQIRRTLDGVREGRAVRLFLNGDTWQAEVIRPTKLQDSDVVLLDPTGVRTPDGRAAVILAMINERREAGTDLRDDPRPPKSDRAREIKRRARRKG
jgi:hypothetical protein